MSSEIMELEDVLDENIIKIHLAAVDKKDALEKMANMLYDNSYILSVEDFVKDVYYRESQGVTGIGQGIAIPHGKSESVEKIGIAIATLQNPIAWETLDGGDVDTIFLFCVRSDGNFARNHMLLLSKVAAKLADEELLVKIRHANSKEEMIQLLNIA